MMEIGMQKLQNKLLASFLLVVSIPMLIGTLASVEIIRRQLHVQLQERLGHSVDGVMLEIEQARAELYLGAKALSSEEELCGAYQSADLRQILRELIQAKNVMGIDCVTAIGAEGTVLARAHEPGRFGDAIATDDVATGVLQGQEHAGMAAGERGIEIEVALPIYTGPGPDLGGVLKVGKLLDYAFLGRLKTKFGLEVMLYNGERLQGTTFVDADVVVGTNHATLQQRVRKQKQRVDMEIWLGEQEYFITAIPLQSQQKRVLGTLLLALSQETVQQTVKYLSLVSGLVGLCLILATTIVCYRVSLTIVRPVQSLSLMADRVAKGDMAQRVQVPSSDEIGQLALSLNEMTEELQTTTTSVETLNQEITTRKQAETELESANQQLIASEQQLQASNQQLRASEEKYRHLYNNAVVGMVTTRISDGKMLECNHRAAQIAGYDTRERCIAGYVATEHYVDPKARKHMIDELMRAGEIEHFEVQITRCDGVPIWVSFAIRIYPEEGYLESVVIDITERKQAQEALHQSEEKYRSLIQNIPDVVWTSDNNGRTSFISSNVERVYGFTAQEIYERGAELWLGRIHPDDVERVKQSFAAVFKEGVQLDVEYRIEHRHGHWIWLHDRSIGAYEKDGVKCADGVFTDITERKRAEAERVRLIDILEATSDFVSTSTPDGELTYLNRAGKRMLGWSEDDSCAGREISDAHPDWAFHVVKNKGIPAAIERGVWEGETALLRSVGTEIPVSQVIMAHKAPGGEVDYFSTIIRDITERKQAEEALREAHERLEERVRERTAELEQANKSLQVEIAERKQAEEQLTVFRRFAEASEQALGMADLEGYITYANSTLCRILGAQKPEEIYDTNVADYYPEEDLPTLQNDILPAVVESGHQVVEMPLLSPEGKRTPSIQSIFLIRDDQGKPFRLANVITDITERKQAEEELRRHHDHLEEMVAERTCELEERHKELQHEITERKQAEEAIKESEERFRNLSEAAFEGIAFTEAGVLIDANEAFVKMYGCTVEELKGKQVMDLVAPEYRQLVTENIRSGYEGVYEHKGLRKDGSLIDLEIHGRSVTYQGRNMRITAIRNITERKQAEEALHRERRLNEELFKTTPAFAVAIDDEGKTVMMNDAMCHALGYAFEEVKGTDYLATFIPERERETLAAVFRTLNTTRESAGIENLVLARDGRELLVEWHGSQVFNTQGEFEFLFGVGIDITERKRVEQALHESEQRYRTLYTSTNEGLALHEIIYDESGRALDYTIVDVNPAFESIVGIERENVIGKKASDIYGTGEAPFLETYAEVARSGKPVNFETTFEPMDKSFRVAAFSPGKGRFATLFADITERIKAQSALRESEERFRALFEQAAVGVAQIVTETGKFLRLNQKYCDIVGYSQEEMEALTFQKITHPADLQADLDNMEKLKQGHIREFSMEKRYYRKDGSIVWVNLTVSPMWRVGEEPYYHIAVVEDITARKQAQERLADYQERLRSLASELSLTEEHERRKMAGHLHDGPCQELAVCLLKLETLHSSLDTSDDRSMLEICQMIRQTVQDLRDLTFDLSPPTLYLVGLEAALEELLKEKLRDEHHILYDFKRANISPLLGDDLRAVLFQCVRELLNNIVKYAQAEKVTVTTRREGSRVQVIVRDDGIGFDINSIESSVSKTGGYGLFSMRERIAYVDGQLEISSQPGQGSRFTITIPLEMKE